MIRFEKPRIRRVGPARNASAGPPSFACTHGGPARLVIRWSHPTSRETRGDSFSPSFVSCGYLQILSSRRLASTPPIRPLPVAELPMRLPDRRLVA